MYRVIAKMYTTNLLEVLVTVPKMWANFQSSFTSTLSKKCNKLIFLFYRTLNFCKAFVSN